jgi:hypothetical protein
LLEVNETVDAVRILEKEVVREADAEDAFPRM